MKLRLYFFCPSTIKHDSPSSRCQEIFVYLKKNYYLCIVKLNTNMDTITSWAKENFDMITLMVGLIGVIIAVISLFVEIKKKKTKK